MKSKYLLQLVLMVIMAVATMAFFEEKYDQKHCTQLNDCCAQKCSSDKKSADNSENIFYNPVSSLIAAVYK